MGRGVYWMFNAKDYTPAKLAGYYCFVGKQMDKVV